MRRSASFIAAATILAGLAALAWMVTPSSAPTGGSETSDFPSTTPVTAARADGPVSRAAPLGTIIRQVAGAVTVQYVTEPAAGTTDEFETAITLTAEGSVDEMIVSVASTGGITVVGGSEPIRIRNVQKGQTIDVPVRVRMTGSGGRLGLFPTAVLGASEICQPIAITYGEVPLVAAGMVDAARNEIVLPAELH
jgi:hypothetical protein